MRVAHLVFEDCSLPCADFFRTIYHQDRVEDCLILVYEQKSTESEHPNQSRIIFKEIGYCQADVCDISTMVSMEHQQYGKYLNKSVFQH